MADALSVLQTIGGMVGDAALAGPEGLAQNLVAKSLGVVESLTKKIIPTFEANMGDFSIFGSIKYWDDIIGKIKESNQSLGIAGELGMNLQSSFRNAYPLVVNMGIKAEEMAKSVQSFFDKTGRAQLLSANEMAELAKMAKVFGDESIEIASAYKTLGMGVQQTTGRMRNLIKESDKFGVLPTKAAGILKQNIDAVNKYSFKNGVKALEQMSIYAARTNTDMQESLRFADKILEGGIEGAMELSTELQLLGGSFGNMGDFSELIYLARNEPEKFQEMFSKAAADMAQFNKETGEVEYSAYAMDVFRKVASATGKSVDNLVKGGKSIKKELFFKDELDASLRGLKNYDELVSKVAGAAFKNEAGDWVVKMKRDGKEIEQAVSSLTEDQIKQISFTDATTGPEAAFEKIATSNETLNETMQRLIESIKVEALSTAAYERFNVVARTAADNIKEMAAPLITQFQELNKAAMDRLFSVLDPLSNGDVSGAMNAVKDNLVDAGNKVLEVGGGVLGDIGQILLNVFSNGAKFLAAGIEWGMRSAMVAFQNGLIGVYNSTFGRMSMFGGEADYIKAEDRMKFSDILKTYNLSDVLEGTYSQQLMKEIFPSSEAKATPSVSETKKETPEMIEKNLTKNEKVVSKVEVSFTNPMELNVDGKNLEVSGKFKDELIEKAVDTQVKILNNESGGTTSKPYEIQMLGSGK